MCVHNLKKPADHLGNSLNPLSFIEDECDSCDYLDPSEGMTWHSTRKDLTLLQFNIRGLINKQNDLLGLVNKITGKNQLDIMMLQETWISNSNEHLVNIPGYKVYLNNRARKKGGGVAVLVNSELKSRKLPDLCINEPHFESCLVEIQLDSCKIAAGSIYRPPNTTEKSFIKSLSNTITKLKQTKHEIAFGLDHNLDLLKSHSHTPTHQFLDLILEKDCIPTITRPTRITKSTATLIDNLIIGRNIFTSQKSGIILNDLSDHFPCIMTLTDMLKNKNDYTEFVSRKIDSKHINQIVDTLNIDWTTHLGNFDTEKSFKLFHDKVNQTLESFTEEKLIKISNKRIIKEPWLTKGIIKASNKQLQLYKNWLQDKDNDVLYERYKQYRNGLKQIKRKAKTEFYTKQCERYKQNSKQLWRLINGVIGKNTDKSCVISYLTIKGVRTYHAKRIRNEFANFFSKIGENLSKNTKPSMHSIDHYLNKIPVNTKSIFLYPCDSQEIKKVITNLKGKHSSGYDGISNHLLKLICHSICKPLSIICNRSMNEGVFPTSMKLAEILPLYKKGDEHLVDNYRPISLLITISKVLEKVLYKRVYNFLDTTGQLYKSQYGFRSKHSCEHAVSELLGNILKGKEKNEHTIAIFLDLSKAFDTLEHSTLLRKLNKYGIRGNAHSWFESYLTDRSLNVKCNVNGSSGLSELRNITFGVPQGSCLGPLLFLVFCNDLYMHLEMTKSILFADDTTIFNSHRDINYLTWTILHDLEILSDWFKANKLTLNLNKSVCIFFKGGHTTGPPPQITIDNTAIQYVNYTKFLGIWIDKDLKWTTHTNTLILKLQRNSNMLFRTKNMLSVQAKKILYFAQIYSHLTYGMSVWGPMATRDAIKKLSSIQLKCIKCIGKNKTDTFMIVSDLIKFELAKFGWKITNKQLPPSLSTNILTTHCGQTLTKTHRYSTRNKAIPNIPAVKNKLYSASIFCKGISFFSNLPTELKNLKSKSLFYKQTKSYLSK